MDAQQRTLDLIKQIEELVPKLPDTIPMGTEDDVIWKAMKVTKDNNWETFNTRMDEFSARNSGTRMGACATSGVDEKVCSLSWPISIALQTNLGCCTSSWTSNCTVFFKSCNGISVMGECF